MVCKTLLASCESSCDELLLDFNCKKCSCIAIGPAHKYNISDMTLCNDKIVWSNKFKYLGVNFIAGKKLSIDVNLIKRSFYVSCNCILGNTKSMDEILKLSLIESHCLPILTMQQVP